LTSQALDSLILGIRIFCNSGGCSSAYPPHPPLSVSASERGTFISFEPYRAVAIRAWFSPLQRRSSLTFGESCFLESCPHLSSVCLQTAPAPLQDFGHVVTRRALDSLLRQRSGARRRGWMSCGRSRRREEHVEHGDEPRRKRLQWRVSAGKCGVVLRVGWRVSAGESPDLLGGICNVSPSISPTHNPHASRRRVEAVGKLLVGWVVGELFHSRREPSPAVPVPIPV